MSAITIPDRTNGQTIDQTWFNLLKEAISQDFVPRDASGIPTDKAGQLGDGSRAWLRAYISSGYFSVADIKMHHSYNGAAPIGEGWMLCDGRVVNQSNYDTEHGSGHWLTYVVSSPLSGKHLPDFTARYPKGKATTTQNGSSAITPIGNTNNEVDFSHAHTMTHMHAAFGFVADANQTFDSSGNAAYLSDSGTISMGALGLALATSVNGLHGATFLDTSKPRNTGGGEPDTGTALSSAQDISPDSIEVQYYMRVI